MLHHIKTISEGQVLADLILIPQSIHFGLRFYMTKSNPDSTCRNTNRFRFEFPFQNRDLPISGLHCQVYWLNLIYRCASISINVDQYCHMPKYYDHCLTSYLYTVYKTLNQHWSMSINLGSISVNQDLPVKLIADHTQHSNSRPCSCFLVIRFHVLSK